MNFLQLLDLINNYLSLAYRIVSEAGRIDILVNNAGVSNYGPTVEIPLDLVKQVLGNKKSFRDFLIKLSTNSFC